MNVEILSRWDAHVGTLPRRNRPNTELERGRVGGWV
jgi:hypothetical protein